MSPTQRKRGHMNRAYVGGLTQGRAGSLFCLLPGNLAALGLGSQAKSCHLLSPSQKASEQEEERDADL